MRYLELRMKKMIAMVLIAVTVTGAVSAFAITTISNTSIQFFNFSTFNKQSSSPANPPTGNATFFAKTDDLFYRLTSSGSEDVFVMGSATQTLSSKTLSSPTMSGTMGGTYTIGGTPTLGSSLALSSDNSISIGTSNARLANLFAAGTVNGTTVRANTLGASTGSTLSFTGSPTISGTYTLGGTPTLGATLTVSGSMTPSTDITYNLGTSTGRFNNIFGSVINGTTVRANNFGTSTGSTITMTGTPTVAGTYTIGGTPTLGSTLSLSSDNSLNIGTSSIRLGNEWLGGTLNATTLRGNTLGTSTGSNISPSSDNSVNLGTGSIRFNNIFSGATINGTTLRGNTLGASTGSTISPPSDLGTILGTSNKRFGNIFGNTINGTNFIIVGGGSIKSSSSTPVAYQVTNTALTIGSLGTIELPVKTTTLYPSDAQGGNIKGSVVYNSANKQIQCRDTNIWIACDAGQRAWGYSAGSTVATSIAATGLLNGAAPTGTVSDSNDADGRAKNIAGTGTGTALKVSTTVFANTERQYNPVLVVRAKNVEYANAEPYWIGFTAAAFPNSGTFTTNHIAIRALQGTDTNFQLDTADGTTQSRTDLGVAVAANAVHTFRIRVDSATPQACVSIDYGAETCKTTNLPSAATDMGLEVTIWQPTGTTKNMKFYWMYLEQDG